MKQKTKKIAVSTVAVLLLFAVLLAAVCTDGFVNFNKWCQQGHDYDENGVCVRCGKEKPAEDKPEPPAVVDDKGNERKLPKKPDYTDKK
ncbi:MAG: hypothetical protein K2G56_02045 [Eubacterium sp.]|nr:hypothetical protein [Eubacterium sp.]